jgi:hypothetical protein
VCRAVLAVPVTSRKRRPGSGENPSA